MVNRNHGGFTLLEVLVALAIVALAATAVLTLSGDLVRRLAEAKERDALALLLWNVATREMQTIKHPAVVNGVCEPPYETCSWIARTESLQLGADVVLGTGTIESGPTNRQAAATRHFLVKFTITCDNGNEMVLERLGTL